MLSTKPATSETKFNLDNPDLNSLTDQRTTPTDNHLNFNCKVEIQDINLDRFAAMNNSNIQSLSLHQQLEIPDRHSQHKCSVSFNFSFDSSIHQTPPAIFRNNTASPSSQCQACKRFFKGRRGLNIHLGRNPDCKRNIAHRNLTNKVNVPTLPQEVRNVIKSPSTSIESLENTCGDGSNTKIKQHNSKHGCKLCHTLSTKDHFVSSSTHRVYEATIPNDITSLNCNSTNVIYLITCRKCRLQYVGETAQLLRERIRHHNSCINHPEKDNTCRVLSEHFSKGLCKNATYTVHIIEKLGGIGRDEKGEIDSAITAIRRKKETDWMLRLRTVFPHGLNGRVGDEYMLEKDCRNVNAKFPPLKRRNSRQRVRSKTFTSSDFILKNFIYVINESLRTDLKNSMNLIRVLLSSLKKSSCKHLYNNITDHLSEKHDSFLFSQYFQAALDILASKLGTLRHPPNKTIKIPSNRCHVTFNNKAVDFINLPRIFRNKDVINALPHNLRKDLPMVVYRLTDTIRSKLFNYKKFVQSIDVNYLLSDNTILPCDCHNSPFINQDHQHVITGNLGIVSDIKLRKLISKGPNYREPVRFSCSDAKKEVINGIDNCIKTWSNKAGLPVAAFRDWKETIIGEIESRILELSSNDRGQQSKSIFENAKARDCLSDLQAKYVMVPIDKASNNVAFICKRYYALVILQELGLLNDSSETYSKIDNETPADIINRHKIELKEQFNMCIDNSMLTLPDIYWTPKLHKNPVKFRFIIASRHCTVKKLSKNISSIFSLFNKQIETYNKKAQYYSGIKSYWIIQNRNPVQETVTKSIARKSAKCLSSFDFSTLYTKIPHDKLADVLQKIIDFVFKGGTRRRIAINKHGTAFWVSDQKSSSVVHTKESIFSAVSYLLRNCYFKFGDKLFRQDIGIPMGSDPAPYFANLFLYHYESSWLKEIKKTNNILARKFGNVYRYIDDLLALNDGKSFESHYHEIYPEELQLTKENVENSETNFLDLHIKINNGIFATSLYDKRDYFGFDITRLPYRISNIPCRMFYSSISAECLRICRATSTDVQAISSIKSLLCRMRNQGADEVMMKNYISRAFCRHQIGHKYSITNHRFVSSLFDQH